MDWNRRYAEKDTPWDKGLAHPVLGQPSSQGILKGRVLVPGCGTGHDVRALARWGLEVVGLDLAPLALRQARAHPPVGHESYLEGDLFSCSNVLGAPFDGVFEHTCFCAIERQRRVDYVAAVAAALRPGGYLLAVFFLTPGQGDEGPPYGCTPKELDELFLSSFRLLQVEEHSPTFPGGEGGELLRLLERV